MYLSHATFTSPLLNGSKQCIDNLYVINEVNPSETHGFLTPYRISLMINNGYDTSYDLIIAKSDKRLRLTKFKGCILFGVKGITYITIQIGYSVGGVFIQLVVEADKPLHFF